MQNWKLPMLFNTPMGWVIALGLLIMVLEILIMTVVQDALSPLHLPEVYWNLMDPILLTIFISPVLYFMVLQKLQSEERFRQINASAQDAIVIANEQGSVIDWNPAAQRMFQYSREEAIGQQMHQLLAPSRFHADAARGFAHFQKTGQGSLIGSIREIVAIRKDSSEFPIEISLSAFKVRGRWHSVGVIRDITERKKLELKKEQYLKFFMLSVNPMCIADPYGCFKRVNPAFVKLIGYSESELLAKPFLDFVLPEDQQKTEDEMKLQVGIRPTLHFDNRYVCKDGTVIDLSWTAYFDKQDGITYATATNITERKQNEARLAEQLEELRRWYDVTSGREGRILDLKHEVNELLVQTGQPPRYPSAESQNQTEK